MDQEPQTQQENVRNENGRVRAWIVWLSSYWTECKRVLRVTKKPTGFEFKTIVKVSGLGMAIIGIIGFLLQFGKEMIF